MRNIFGIICVAAAWQSVRTVTVLAGRFAVRAFLDDRGAPSTARILTTFWTFWMAWYFTETTSGLGPLYRPPEPHLTQAIVAFGALLVVWSASLKLGAAVFIPVAEALAQALGKVVSVGATATEILTRRMAPAYEPPDRTVALADRELARPSDPPDPRQPHPYDDERG